MGLGASGPSGDLSPNPLPWRYRASSWPVPLERYSSFRPHHSEVRTRTFRPVTSAPRRSSIPDKGSGPLLRGKINVGKMVLPALGGDGAPTDAGLSVPSGTFPLPDPALGNPSKPQDPGPGVKHSGPPLERAGKVKPGDPSHHVARGESAAPPARGRGSVRALGGPQPLPLPGVGGFSFAQGRRGRRAGPAAHGRDVRRAFPTDESPASRGP